MSSIVDTSVKNFNSTMTGAPALSGTAGTLIALLDAVLVNGFDLRTPSSLTVAGGVATLAITGSHSAQQDCVILVAGSSIAALNGEQKVTAAGAGFVKFATAAADGAASGSISFKMAPAGWEKVYTGTNKAVYRSLDPLSTKMLLRVDDSNAQFARVVGYEVMTDVDTGVGAFPTAAQINGGGYWAKSNVASATTVPWAVHADSRFFAFTPQYGVATNVAYQGGVTRSFGDCIPKRPGGDGYLCVLNYSITATVAQQTDSSLFSNIAYQIATPRSYTGLGSSSLHISWPYTGVQASSASGLDSALGAFPSRVDGSLQLSKRYVTSVELGGSPRGDIPGLYHVPQSGLYDSFKQFDRAPGALDLAGRVLQAVATIGSGSAINGATTTSTNVGAGFFDITGPWR